MKLNTETKERKIEYNEYDLHLTEDEMNAVLQALEVAHNPSARMSAGNAAISASLFNDLMKEVYNGF